MCLALPMRIVAIDGALATIAAEGLEQRASIMLVPDAVVGDYVLVHAGFAISVIDEAEANETFDLLREIGAFALEAEGAEGEDVEGRLGADRDGETSGSEHDDDAG
jgi:hydrogenase expression/formation protein HypC